MKAMVAEKQGPMNNATLKAKNVEAPTPGPDEVLVRVNVCGVCRTDLHVIEGDLKAKKLPIIPGHQIVGEVEKLGRSARGFEKGDRVGVTWINSACGRCKFCRSGMDNLCDSMRFTGYDVDGGYAEYVTVSKDYAFHVPENFDDAHAAPLFCAGVIGYRALRLSGIKPRQRLAIFGFGSSGHILAQIARYWKCEVYAFTRGKDHQKLALSLGASWAGEATDRAPERYDAAVITAPAGELVINALDGIEKGGKIAIQDIYMSRIPEIDYNRQLYGERSICSVTNYTKSDVREFLELASEMPIKTTVQEFRLAEANRALLLLKDGKLRGSGVLKI